MNDTHPLVAQILERARTLGISHSELTARAGVYDNALHQWTKRGSTPNALHLDAVARVVGMRLALAPADWSGDTRISAAEDALRETERAVTRLRAALSDLAIDKTA